MPDRTKAPAAASFKYFAQDMCNKAKPEETDAACKGLRIATRVRVSKTEPCWR